MRSRPCGDAEPRLRARRSTSGGRPGVGEGGGADLDGGGAGQHELGGVRARWRRRRRRRSAGRGARRGRRGPRGRRSGGWPGPTAPRPATRSRGGSAPVSGSMAMPSTVLTSVTASAPPSTRGLGDRDEVGDVRAELRPPRAAAARRWPPWPPRVSSAEWAKRSRAASVFGQERFTSTATTSAGASARSAAAASYSRDACDPRSTRRRARRRRAAAAGRAPATPPRRGPAGRRC